MTKYMQGLIVQSAIVAIAVSGMFPMTGLTGMVSFGQAAFMAVGSYFMAIISSQLGVPLLLSCVIGVVACVIVSLIVAIPTMKLRRDYFSLVSISLNQAISALIITFASITGGAIGYSRIKKVPNLMWIALGIMVITFIFIYNYKRSRFGRMSLAVKNDELASRSFGIKVYPLKIKNYMIGSIFAGIAGILYAFQTRIIDPSSFDWGMSSELTLFTFFGGTNSLFGSTLSAFILKLLPEQLRNVTIFGQSLQIYRVIIYSILIIIIINFRPAGVFGEWEPTTENLRRLSQKAASLSKRIPGTKKRGGNSDE